MHNQAKAFPYSLLTAMPAESVEKKKLFFSKEEAFIKEPIVGYYLYGKRVGGGRDIKKIKLVAAV